jgi:hypothetical protein
MTATFATWHLPKQQDTLLTYLLLGVVDDVAVPNLLPLNFPNLEFLSLSIPVPATHWREPFEKLRVLDVTIRPKPLAQYTIQYLAFVKAALTNGCLQATNRITLRYLTPSGAPMLESLSRSSELSEICDDRSIDLRHSQSRLAEDISHLF